MTYHFNEEVVIGDKTFAKGDELELTEDQIQTLEADKLEAFTAALNDGRITEAPVEPDVQEPEVDAPKEETEAKAEEPAVEPEPTAPASPEEPKSAEPVAAPSAPASDSPWVGKHTIGGANTLPGGSLMKRDPSMGGKA